MGKRPWPFLLVFQQVVFLAQGRQGTKNTEDIRKLQNFRLTQQASFGAFVSSWLTSIT
jgi:hypothetical protein